MQTWVICNSQTLTLMQPSRMPLFRTPPAHSLTHSDSLTQTHSLRLALSHSDSLTGVQSMLDASAPTQLPSQLPSLRNYSAAPPTGLTVASPPLPQDPPHSPWHSRLQLHSVVPLQTKFALTIWITLARGLKRGRRQGTVLTANETVDVAGDVAGLPLSLW